MNKNVVMLLEILEKEQVYSLQKLKEKLAQKKLFLSEKEIMNLIVETLFESICHFRLEKKYNSNILYKCFKYLNAENNKNYIDDVNDFVEKINHTIEKIDKKIEDKKSNINSICRENISFLLRIKDNLELTVIQFSIPIEDKEEDKETIEKTIYKFIFDIKKYNYVEEIFKTFPELVNFRTHCNKYILDDVITKYLECLNEENGFDEIYYEKIIDLFINSENFNITKAYKNHLVNRLLLAKNNLNNNDNSKRKNKKIRFFLNDAINHLEKFDITDCEQFFSNINYRYGIQDSYNGNYFDRFKSRNNITINRNILDLTHKYTFTIDNKGTKSFDDAFSLVKTKNDNYELDIYISDITKYVDENTKLDQLAFKKGATIYLPDHTLTMLPHSLTFENCSLVKNNYRNVITHRFIISKNFDIISFDIFEAIININDNFYYDNIIEILNGNDIEKLKIFSTMIDISNNFRRNNLYNADYHIFKSIRKKLINPNEDLLQKHQNSHTNFVDTFMVLTNYFVSDLFDRLDFPFLYRVNTSNFDNNLIKNITSMEDSNEEDAPNKIIDFINNLYEPSYYSSVNLGHKGLNLKSYGHITIPIRNYASLYSQRLEYKYLISNYGIDDNAIYEDEQRIIEVANYENDRIFYNEEYVKEYKEKIKVLKNN